MILAQDLEGLAFRSFGIAGERIEPRLSGCHFRLCGRDLIEPSSARPTRRRCCVRAPGECRSTPVWRIFTAGSLGWEAA
jgi:hypothetical protein